MTTPGIDRRLSWALCVLGLASSGCDNRDPCQKYTDDYVDRENACGLHEEKHPYPSYACTEAVVREVECFDACLSKIDCDCIQTPTASGCDVKMKPYYDCAMPCLPK
jgi:hypothetical protein